MANILIIIPALYCGGGLQKISLQLSQELIRRGHRVTVVDKHDPPMDKISYLDTFPKFEKIDSYIPNTKNIKQFCDILNVNDIDIIIYEGYFNEVNNFLTNVKRYINIPILSVYHNSPDASMPKGRNSIPSIGLKNLIKKFGYHLYEKYSRLKVGKFLKSPSKFSDKVILLSESFRDLYYDFTKVCKNIEIITNFVYPPSINCNKERKKQLLYVGRLEEEAKKFSRVLKIWEKIHTDYPEWSLVIAGEGRCKDQYEQYVKDKSLPRVTFLGYVADPSELYQASKISLMTSDYEGFGLVLVEAMSNGCIPMAYNSFRSLTDIIDDRVNGMVIDPFKEDLYIERLRLLMNDEVLQSKMSFNAQLKSHMFYPNSIVSKWETLIEFTLKNKGV